MNFKKVTAITLSASLLMSSAVFAAEAKQAEPTVITYDVAVERAIKNTRTIATLNETIEYLEDYNEYLWDGLNNFVVWEGNNYDIDYSAETAYAGISLVSGLLTANGYSSTVKQSELQKEMLEDTAELTAKSYLNGITIGEKSLELMRDSLQVQREGYRQAQIKNKLGMLSDRDLESTKNSLAAAESSYKASETALQSTYKSFEKLIGIKNNEEYVIDYEITYEPFQLEIPISSYIQVKSKSDLSVKIADETIANAKFQKAINIEQDTDPYSYEKKTNAVNQAERDKAETVDNLKVNMQSCANSITETEKKIEAKKLEIENLKQQYDTLEIMLKTGQTTQYTLDQTKLGIDSAEMELLQLYSTYDTLKIQMKYPFLLSGGK